MEKMNENLIFEVPLSEAGWQESVATNWRKNILEFVQLPICWRDFAGG
ncbi:MAG: hypothetical protein AABW85_03365 [archaeon]